MIGLGAYVLTMLDHLNGGIITRIVLAANDGKALSSLWIFRLRAVSRAFRDTLEPVLMDGDLLVAEIHRCLQEEVWQHHYGCLQEYTVELHDYLLKIASESKTAGELCELLIDTAFEIRPVPALKRMLMEAAAGAACTPELQWGLHQLEDDDAQTRFGPLVLNPLKMAAVRKRVRAAAASILPWAGRQGTDQLNTECAEAVRRLDQCIVAYLDPAAPAVSVIMWAGLQWKYTIETAWTKRHCAVRDSLRLLCIRWLLATASIEPSSDFGAALKYLMAAGPTPHADADAGTALAAGPTPHADAGTALACMVTAVQDMRRLARPDRPKPRLTDIMIQFWYQPGDYSLPPLTARASGPDLCWRLFSVGNFHCSSPDCGWWRRT